MRQAIYRLMAPGTRGVRSCRRAGRTGRRSDDEAQFGMRASFRAHPKRIFWPWCLLPVRGAKIRSWAALLRTWPIRPMRRSTTARNLRVCSGYAATADAGQSRRVMLGSCHDLHHGYEERLQLAPDGRYVRCRGRKNNNDPCPRGWKEVPSKERSSPLCISRTLFRPSWRRIRFHIERRYERNLLPRSRPRRSFYTGALTMNDNGCVRLRG